MIFFFNGFTFDVIVVLIICAIIAGFTVLQPIIPIIAVIVVAAIIITSIIYFLNSVKSNRVNGCGPIASAISSVLAIIDAILVFKDFMSYGNDIGGTILFSFGFIFGGGLLIWALYGWMGANTSDTSDPIEMYKDIIVEIIATIITIVQYT